MSSKIKKDIMSVIGGRVFTSGLYFTFIGILMAILSVEDYGKYTYYYSLIAIIPFFMDLGTNNAFLSLGAKKINDEQHVFEVCRSNYLAIKYLLFLVFILFALVLFLIGKLNYILLIVLITGIFVALQELMVNLLAVKKKFGRFSILMPMKNILSLAILMLFIFFMGEGELNANNSIFILSIATVISMIFYLLFGKDYFFEKKLISIDECKQLCSYSSWLVVYGFCIALMMRIDIFILEYYSANHTFIDSNELGYFSAAFSLGLVLPMVTNSIVKVAFPNLSQFNTTSQVKKYISLVRRATLPISLCVFMFSIFVVFLVKMYFYEKYGSSIDIFLVISLATMISFFTNLLLPLFYTANKTFFIAKLGMAQLVVNILASFILIYFYGALGASISILVVRLIGLVVVILNIKSITLANN